MNRRIKAGQLRASLERGQQSLCLDSKASHSRWSGTVGGKQHLVAPATQEIMIRQWMPDAA
jgi:hypothetical protein